MRARTSVFARCGGEVCAEGGVREGALRTWKVCVRAFFLLGLVLMEMSPFKAAVHIPTHWLYF